MVSAAIAQPEGMRASATGVMLVQVPAVAPPA